VGSLVQPGANYSLVIFPGPQVQQLQLQFALTVSA
jgi:hypothetical protein